MWPVDRPIEKPPRPSRLAVQLGLPPDTPDNVIVVIAGSMDANNKCREIKEEYDSNNPTPPAARQEEKTGGDRSAPTDVGD